MRDGTACHHRQGNFAGALADYSKAVDLGYRHTHGFLVAAILHQKLGDLETATLMCNQVLDLSPKPRLR
jgi:hypothetical protein